MHDSHGKDMGWTNISETHRCYLSYIPLETDIYREENVRKTAFGFEICECTAQGFGLLHSTVPTHIHQLQ